MVVLGHMTNLMYYISIWIKPIATKYGKVVNYREGLQQVESHDPLITCFCEVTWQIENMSTSTMLLTTKLVSVVTSIEELPLVKSHNPSIMRSYKVTSVYEIWQGSDLPCWASANKTFKHVA